MFVLLISFSFLSLFSFYLMVDFLSRSEASQGCQVPKKKMAKFSFLKYYFIQDKKDQMVKSVVPKLFWCADYLKHFSAQRN
jgi:hypothetical protein